MVLTLASPDSVLQSCNARQGYAQWENNTDKMIAKNQFKKRFEALKAQAEANLDARREKLAAMLLAEEAALKQELVDRQQTPEERHHALEARARALFKQREDERAQFAQEMLYRQWREGCDGVRQGDSKAKTVSTVEGRKAQLDEKLAKKRAEEEEKRYYDAEYEKLRLKKEERFLADVAAQEKLKAEAIRALDEQVAQVSSRRVAEVEVAKSEVEQMKQRWAEEEDAHKVILAAKAEKERVRLEEVKAFNDAKRKADAVVKAEDEAFNLKLVQDAARQVAEEDARDRELRARKKEQDAQYRVHLAALMVKEAVSEEERDRLIEEQQLKYDAKRQAEKDRQEAARAKLWSEVDADRQRQLGMKAEKRRAFDEEKEYERQRMEAELAEMTALEREYTAQANAQRIQNRLDIEAQIHYKESLQQKKREEAQQAWEGAQQAEKEYQQMIDYDAAQAKPAAPNYARKATKWYS